MIYYFENHVSEILKELKRYTVLVSKVYIKIINYDKIY